MNGRREKVSLHIPGPVGFLLFLVLIFVGSTDPHAQGPINLEPWVVLGDSLWGSRETGSEIQRPDIRHGDLQVRALRGRINPDRTLLVLIGSVEIEDSLGRVTANQGVYRRLDRVLDMAGRVRGTGPEGKFRARELTYDRRYEVVDLRGRPEIADSTRIIWADRVRFENGTGRGEAHGDVRVLLLADSTWVNGEHAQYDRTTGDVWIYGDPWLFRPGLTPEQDLTVWADTLAMNQPRRQGVAYGNVRIQRGNVQAIGEEATFELVRNRTLLTGNPVAWDLEGEIRADTMDIRLRAGADDVLRAFGNVSVDYRSRENPGETQFVLGDTLDALIAGGRVTGLDVTGDAYSLYTPNLDEMRRGTGKNLTNARRIELTLRNGTVDRVDFIEQASGEYRYPSPASIRKLRDPAFIDSIAPAGGGRLFRDLPSREVVAESPDGESANDEAPGGERELGDTPVGEPVLEGIPIEREPGQGTPGEGPRIQARIPRGDVESIVTGAAPDSNWMSPEQSAADSLADLQAETFRDERSRIPDEFAPPRPEEGVERKAIDPRLAYFRQNRSLELPDSLDTPFEALYDEIVVYSGDTIRFHTAEDQLSIRGAGKLNYAQNDLESEWIDFLADQDLVVASGEPKLRDDGSEVIGERMTYRTDVKEGMVYQGKTEYDGGFYYGKAIKKLEEDALLVQEGDYTTCNADPPHYHFHSKRMKLILDDKAVARPVVLHIRNIPIFAIPYYFFPIDKGRRSGFLFPDIEFGFSDRGRFIENLGYYWAINDYMDAKAWMDYFDEGPEVEFSGEFRYRKRYLLNGSFNASFLDESSDNGGRQRWSVDGSHVQELGDRSDIRVRADFRSDKDFIEDYDIGAGVDERLNRQLDSSVAYRKSWDTLGLSLSADASRTQYLDDQAGGGLERIENFPSVRLSMSSIALGQVADEIGRGGRLPFLASTYFQNSMQYRRVFRKSFATFEDSTFVPATKEENSAASSDWSLRDNRNLGPYLTISPSISGRVAWFQEDNRGRKNQVGATWTSSLSARNNLYGTLPWEVGPLVGLRHVISPSVGVSYQPEFESLTYDEIEVVDDSTTVVREDQSTFPSVGGIGLSGRESARLNLSIGQSVHTKWQLGEQVAKKENVVQVSSSTSYDFLADDDPWSSIRNSVQFRPFRTFDSSYSFTVDPYRWVATDYSVRTNLSVTSSMFQRKAASDSTEAEGLEYGEFGQAELQGTDIGNRELERSGGASIPWNLRLSHSYSGRRGSDQKDNRLNASLGFTPSANWRVTSSAYFDLAENEFISHSFSLERSLHCWQFRFERRSSGNYLFRIFITDIPEVEYKNQN